MSTESTTSLTAAWSACPHCKKMDTTHPDSLDHCDRDDFGDEEQLTPLWWIVIWSIWGLMVGSIILWLDRDPITAVIWLLAGIVIGTCAIRFFGPFTSSVFDWYHHFTSDSEETDRIIRLVMDDKTDTEEFDRLCENEANRSMLFVPPMFGLLYGVLLGAIGGSLCRLDSTLNITASQGAIWGVILGVIWISILAAVVLAVIVPQDKTLPPKSRIARRLQMIISPIFIFPAVWHGVRWLLKRRHTNTI